MNGISRRIAPLFLLFTACPGPAGGPLDRVKAGGTSPRALSDANTAPDPVLSTAPPGYARGVEALQRHPPDLRSALGAFREALETKPDHREARLNAAYCLLRLGRFAEAEPLYRKAAAAEDRDALKGHVDVLLRLGRAPEALKALDAWIHKRPKDLQILSLAAEAERQANDPDRALKRVQQVLTLDRTDAEAHVQFGMLFLHRKDARTALMVFGRGLGHHPKHARLHLGRGLAWLSQGEMGRAVMDFEEAVKLDGSVITGRLLLGKVYLDNLDFDGAKRHFTAVLHQWPRHSEAMLGRARALFGKKQFKEALASYKAVISEHGELPQALFQVARLYQDHLDSAQEALDYYRRFVRAQPDLNKDDPVFATIRMLESMKGVSPRKAPTPEGPTRAVDQGGKQP